MHNMNIYSLTGYKPIDLLYISNEDIYNEVIETIKKNMEKKLVITKKL